MRRLCCLLAALCLLLTGCGTKETAFEADVFAMDTVTHLQVWGDETVLRQAEQLLYDLEANYSVTREGSLLSRMAAGERVTLTEAEWDLLSRAVALSEATDGAYDPTIYPVVRLWGFTTDSQRVPTQARIQDALTHVGLDHLYLKEGTAQLEDGAALDFGGILKGYAAERILDLLTERQVTAACVSLGGNVQTYGTKPDGSPWRIGIRDPWNGDATLGVLTVEGTMAVVTSGSYQRYFEENGTVYHHIMDPETGFPADSGLVSVTIVCDSGLKADGLSTALFVMGLEEATRFWRDHRDFEAVFATEDGNIYVTEGIFADFSCEEAQVIKYEN